MLKQRAQTTKAYKSPPAHMHAPPEQVPNLGTNRSGRFPKPVRPVPPKPFRPVLQTGQADFTQQTTPPKAKNAKEMHKLPLALGIGSRDGMQLFSEPV
jgi:hypothetical protein